MVICEVCGKELNMVTNSHLALHGMTPEEYRTRYPGVAMFDEEVRKIIHQTRHRVERPKCMHPKCDNSVTESYNIFCSNSCRSSYNFSKEYRNLQGGERSRLYKHGRSIAKAERIAKNRKYTKYSRKGEWKKLGDSQKRLARERDSFECQKCGEPVSGKKAHVHHIVAERCFDDANIAHDLGNLVTLCWHCHNFIEADTKKELHIHSNILEQLIQENPEIKELIARKYPNFMPFSEFKEFMFDFRRGKNSA